MSKFPLTIAFGVLLVVIAACAYPAAQENASEECDDCVFSETLARRRLCRNDSTSDENNLNVQESLVPMIATVSNLTSLEEFLAGIGQVTNETRFNFFPRYCPQLKTAGPRVHGVLKAVKPCLKEEDFLIVSALANTLPGVVELVCNNDGEALFQNYDPLYSDCMNTLKEPQSCKELKTIDDNYHPAKLTQDQCGNLFHYKHCVHYFVSTCRTPDFTIMYDAFFNTLFRSTPCRDYIAAQDVMPTDNKTIS